MTSPVPAEPITSYTTDFPFRILQVVTTGLVLVLALTAAIDIMAGNWGVAIFELVLMVLLAAVGMRRAFALVRAATTVDEDGLRRRNGWDLAWGEVSAAWIELVRDVPHLVVLPRRVRPGTDLTRFFLRDPSLPKDALVSPLDPHKAGRFREFLESQGYGQRPTA